MKTATLNAIHVKLQQRTAQVATLTTHIELKWDLLVFVLMDILITIPLFVKNVVAIACYATQMVVQFVTLIATEH